MKKIVLEKGSVRLQEELGRDLKENNLRSHVDPTATYVLILRRVEEK